MCRSENGTNSFHASCHNLVTAGYRPLHFSSKTSLAANASAGDTAA